jgi:hypothetical protein
VASPIEEDEKAVVTLAKKLKKNNIAVDLVLFGQIEENEAKLTKFIETLNNNDNSHLVSIPPGPHLLSDVLISSPIISGEDGPPPGFGGNFEFGIDPSLDPELALVRSNLSRLLKCLWKKKRLAKKNQDRVLLQQLKMWLQKVMRWNKILNLLLLWQCPWERNQQRIHPC